MPNYGPDRMCHCGHSRDEHCVMTADNCACIACKCRGFRPLVFASYRQLTGTPYIYHAYVYEGNKVVMACTHQHGERRSVDPITGEVKNRGSVQAQACAERMLRKYLKRTRKVA